uniref:Sphingomyelin phosphodiesterase C-terminal domain-containing protein n=1 Tax=Hyaloperonospora arabidopsidis (strain Emoy2) TaxID=559515 RepID=M4BNJ4_HYAAE
MAGAISPIFSSNPAFMVWDYDVTTHDLLDFTVHGGNISATSGSVDWQPLFKASQEYGVSTLKASEIVNFVKRAETDAKLLEEYYFNSKAQSRLQSKCQDATCQAEWLCSFYWFSTVRDYEACVASTTASKSNTTTSTVQ